MSNVPTNLIPSTITQLPEYQGSSTAGYFAYSLGGRSYKVQFSQLAAVGAVPSTRVIAAGTGLTGGGDLSQDRVISIANGGVGTAQLADSGVIAGVYGSGSDVPVLTIDAKGRVTSATTSPLSITGYVPDSRVLTAGAGLTGGGNLSANRTFSVDFYASAPQALGSASPGVSNAAARGDHVHPAVDLSDTDQTQGALPLGRGGTGDALSPVAGAVVYSTGTKLALADAGLPGQVLTSDGTGEPYWSTISGTGTVTDVSVVTANGFAGTVANPNTTPAITISTTVTGVLKGNGTAISAAVAGTDYVAPGAITGSGLTMATSRLLGRTSASTGAVEEITVGTGLSLSGGSLTNSAPDQVVSFTSGTGISVTGTYPSFTITNTAPDQVVSLTAGSNVSITGTYPNFTIAASDQYTGTVTSVAASGGTTGLTFSGSPITTSGTLTLGGTLAVANGGTGQTTASAAFNALSPITTTGDLIIGNGTNSATRLAIGANGYILTSDGTTASWGPVPSSMVYPGAGIAVSTGSAWGTSFNNTGTPITVAYGGTGATSLTSGYLVKGNGTSAASASVIYDTGTNVGIGTNIPGYRLTVIGGDTTNAFIAGATRGVRFAFNSTTSRIEGVDGTGAASYQPLDINGSIVTTSISGTEKMRLDASGNLGIGVTPMATGANGNLLQIGNPTTSTGSGLTIGSTTTADIQFSDATTGTGQYAGLIRYSHSTDNMALWTASAERMRIDSSGNVGIGVTNPSAKVDLAAGSGTAQVGLRIRSVAANANGFNILTNSTTDEVSLTNFYNASVILGTNNTERMRITAAGNVGIGTSSPSYRLHVVGGTSGQYKASGDNMAFQGSTSDTSNNYLRLQNTTGYFDFTLGNASCTINNAVNGPTLFNTNSTERMRIGANGSVAIGGTGTDATLHIQQSYGGYDRLTQIAPSGTSKNAFNIMAAKNSGGADDWWTWGVRTDAVWCLIPGVDSAMTSSTGVYFDSTAQAYKPGGGSWQATSDARVKINIAPITDAASRIMALKPSSFDYRAPEAHAGRVSDRGFIAQEFEEVYPHSVGEIGLICDEEKDLLPEGEKLKTLGLNNDFFADLVAVMQEQQSTISELRARVAQLEGK